MEENATDDVTYFLVMDIAHKQDLGTIRHWSGLKVAFEEDKIWITGFDEEQIQSIEVKSIPIKTLFYEKRGKLFFLKSLLPERNAPSLLWSPIDRALPIMLPAFNHNFFGLEEKIDLKLISSDEAYESVVMITTLEILYKYTTTAAAIRLQNLYWIILDNDKVLIKGNPLLPIKGEVYYKKEDFFIPAGYCFNNSILMNTMNTILNPDKDQWIVWDIDTSYLKISKIDLQPLSISSIRRTMNRFSSL